MNRNEVIDINKRYAAMLQIEADQLMAEVQEKDKQHQRIMKQIEALNIVIEGEGDLLNKGQDKQQHINQRNMNEQRGQERETKQQSVNQSNVNEQPKQERESKKQTENQSTSNVNYEQNENLKKQQPDGESQHHFESNNETKSSSFEHNEVAATKNDYKSNGKSQGSLESLAASPSKMDRLEEIERKLLDKRGSLLS